MGRDTLELADDSLFIDKIKHTFTAADTELLTRAYAFSKESACGCSSVPLQAAELLLDQDVDAITIAGALLAPLLWQDLANPDEIKKHFGRTVAAALEDLNSPSILHSAARQYHRGDVHTLLASMMGGPRKALLFITFRLLALENATKSSETADRKMAQETLDFYVPIANRLSLGELRCRLEDACFHILDRVGLRVIVTSVPECYAVLGLLHSHFKPIAGTFDDYICFPKYNGYQSLHTCVYPVREISHKPIDLQYANSTNSI